jgi:hypothetical protein
MTMGSMQDAQREIAKKRAQTAQLKSIISDKKELATPVRDADRLVIAGKALDVFGFIMTGIDIVTVIKDAMQVARSLQLLHDSELGMITLEQSGAIARHAASGSTSVMAASRFLFAANVLSVLATYVGVWISLGSGYAQAKVDILTEEAMSGASRGAILGANNAAHSYVVQHFQKRVRPSYPMYREAEAAAMNMYNVALLAGYAHGKNLSQNQKVNLGKYLLNNMSAGQRSYFSGEWSTWSPRRKIDYYIETAAVFRRLLLR